MLFVLFYWVIAKQREPRLAHVTAPNFVIKRHQKLFDGSRTVKANHLIREQKERI